jgi:glutaredoxin
MLSGMRCSRHDLALAADGKCVRCRREEGTAADQQTSPRSRELRVVAVLGAGFVVAGVLAWAIRPHTVTAPVAPPQASAIYTSPSAPPLVPLEPAAVAADPTPAPSGSNAPTPLDRAMHTAQITLYTRPTSSDCAPARAWLLAHGYAFRERDVDADNEGRAGWQKASPDGVVPAFDIDGQSFAGFDAARVEAALQYAGVRRLQRR